MEHLNQGELLDVLRAYDRYIQNANDENRYADGWFPVCIAEFYDNEYQALLAEQSEKEPAEYGTYTVTITETLKMDVEVDADSQEDAEQIANDNWRNSEYILDADNFVEVDFKAKPPQKEPVKESILARLAVAKKQAAAQTPKANEPNHHRGPER